MTAPKVPPSAKARQDTVKKTGPDPPGKEPDDQNEQRYAQEEDVHARRRILQPADAIDPQLLPSHGGPRPRSARTATALLPPADGLPPAW